MPTSTASTVPSTSALGANGSQKGSVLLFLLIGIFVITLGFLGAYYLYNSNKPVSQVLTQAKIELPVVAASRENSLIQATPTLTPIDLNWKIYTNPQYKIQFRYPAKGMIMGENGYFEGDCGSYIEEKDDSQYHHIYFDNLMDIKIKNWPKTVEDYLITIGASGQYDLEDIQNSGATEAVKVVGLKKGKEYAVGFPPLIYINYIYQKGDNLFLLSDFQTPSIHPKGCTNPKVLDPVAHSHLRIKDWDISKSFKVN